MLKKRTRLSLILLCLLFVSLHAQETSFLSMEAAVNKALEQNSNVLSGKYGLQKAKWDKFHSWTLLLPTASFNTRYTWIDKETLALRDFFRQNIHMFFPNLPPGTEIPQTVFQEAYYTSFDVNMTLFNGAIWSGIAYAGVAKDLAAWQFTATQNITVFQVISTYLNAIYARDILKLQEEYLTLSELNYQKAERLQKAGRYSKLEALRWKVDLQQQKSSVSVSASGLRTALAALARVTSTPMDVKIQMEDKLPENLAQESIRLQNLDDGSLLKMIDLNENEL